MPILTPYQATAAPGTLLSAVGDVVDCYHKAKNGVCPGATPLFSVREAPGNFKKMLKPWKGQDKYPFSIKCDSGGHHSTRGE